MTEEKYIDHTCTDEIVCPHCGAKSEWDYEGGSTFEEECGSCEKEFRVEVESIPSFSTSKFDRAAEEAERQKRIAEHRDRVEADKLACAKFPPGTRVQLIEKKYSARYSGRLGTVANEELSTMVRVNLDERSVDGKRYPAQRSSFNHWQLKRI